ncbi:hypothetical protein LZ31DRAFT_560695 [Colletotrichum somersetense]|nr:hypothetical protein LZ31DRAFT_560695 [Colletotrichum somersetense]
MAGHISANTTGPAHGVLVVPAARPDISASAAAPANTSVPSRRTKLQTAAIVGSLCAAVFVAALDVTIITTALPAITDFFRSLTGYQWVGGGYVLPHTASVPLWGKLSDIWGRKLVFLGLAACGGAGRPGDFGQVGRHRPTPQQPAEGRVKHHIQFAQGHVDHVYRLCRAITYRRAFL